VSLRGATSLCSHIINDTLSLSLSLSLLQHFNVSGAEQLCLDNPAFTSTPVCGQKSLLATPIHKETTPKSQKENAG